MKRWWRRWWWLVFLGAISIGDGLVIWLAHLHAAVGVGLAAASFTALAATASAVATTRAVEVSERIDAAGQRATVALSRALLPSTMQQYPLTLSPDRKLLVLGVGAYVVRVERRSRDGASVQKARRSRRPDDHFFSWNTPTPFTRAILRTWADCSFRITITDEQGLACWDVDADGGTLLIGATDDIDPKTAAEDVPAGWTGTIEVASLDAARPATC